MSEPDGQSDETDDPGFLELFGQHSRGMFLDLVFAVVWVAGVSVLVEVLDGPTWALYLLLLAGIPAYYLFFTSLAQAKARQRAGEE